MNPQPEEDLQRRLQKLEAEINSPSVGIPQSQEIVKPSPKGFPSYQERIAQLFAWFNSQSVAGKVIVLGVAFVLAFTILQAILKLVAAEHYM